ncbi:MAG: DUF2853 family protein [Pseudomonadota bacterium]
MSKRDELIEKYAADLSEKCGVTPDMALLTKVTEALGPAIYNPDSALVSSSSDSEMDTVRQNFLIGKLGLGDGPELEAGLKAAIETYGSSEKQKHRAVIYYLLVKHFGKEAVYA